MTGDQICWFCQRALGDRVEWHHPVPKSRGGRERVAVHPICHRAIHASFTNGALAKLPASPDALRSEPGLARFLEWIANKPPDFHAPTHGGRGKRQR